MSHQGDRRTGTSAQEDAWWAELYDDVAEDAGPAPGAVDSLDDRFASAAGTLSSVPPQAPAPGQPGAWWERPCAAAPTGARPGPVRTEPGGAASLPPQAPEAREGSGRHPRGDAAREPAGGGDRAAADRPDRADAGSATPDGAGVPGAPDPDPDTDTAGSPDGRPSAGAPWSGTGDGGERDGPRRPEAGARGAGRSPSKGAARPVAADGPRTGAKGADRGGRGGGLRGTGSPGRDADAPPQAGTPARREDGPPRGEGAPAGPGREQAPPGEGEAEESPPNRHAEAPRSGPGVFDQFADAAGPGGRPTGPPERPSAPRAVAETEAAPRGTDTGPDAPGSASARPPHTGPEPADGPPRPPQAQAPTDGRGTGEGPSAQGRPPAAEPPRDPGQDAPRHPGPEPDPAAGRPRTSPAQPPPGTGPPWPLGRWAHRSSPTTPGGADRSGPVAGTAADGTTTNGVPEASAGHLPPAGPATAPGPKEAPVPAGDPRAGTARPRRTPPFDTWSASGGDSGEPLWPAAMRPPHAPAPFTDGCPDTPAPPAPGPAPDEDASAPVTELPPAPERLPHRRDRRGERAVAPAPVPPAGGPRVPGGSGAPPGPRAGLVPEPPYVGDGPPTYDAEPAALPAADPDHLDHLVPDTVLDGGRHGSLTLRAVSLRGDSARFRGEPRRDALLTARFGTGQDAVVLVAAATGARSATEAHRAAAEACGRIARAVGRSQPRLAGDLRDGRRAELASGLRRLTDHVLGRLRARAAELGVGPEAYTASLRCLLLPADPACATRVFFGVGDGGLHRLRDGTWQDLEPRPGEHGDARPDAVADAGGRAPVDLGIAVPPGPWEPAVEPVRAPFRFRASVGRPGDVLLLSTAGLAAPLREEPAFAARLGARWGEGPAPGLDGFLADARLRVEGYADDRTAAAVWEA